MTSGSRNKREVYVVMSRKDGSPHPFCEAVYNNEEAARAHEADLADSLDVVARDIHCRPVESEYDDGLRADGGADLSETNLLEREAEALVEIFNDAAPDYSPDLEWFAMDHDHETGAVQFVLEAEGYIDTDGLNALREHGREVRYIEAYALDEEVVVTISVPVQNSVPNCSVDTGTSHQRGER